MLCKRKGVNIVEAEICPDHVHMLVEILPNISVASFVGYLKGKSTLIIFERHANLKYKYGNRHFWCRGYYVDTVGKNAKKIQEYIQNQLKEDLEYDQMTLKEYIDPFTGDKASKESPLGLSREMMLWLASFLGPVPVTAPYRGRETTGSAGGCDFGDNPKPLCS